MRALKQVLSPIRAVTSVTSALTFGSVGKPAVSGLARMARSVNPIARFRRAPETVKSQKPNTDIVPPANVRIRSVQLSGIVMNVDFISKELEQHSTGSFAHTEIKLLDATAQFYLSHIDTKGSDDAACLTDLTHLRDAFVSFESRANKEFWGKEVPANFLEKLSMRIVMMGAQLKTLNDSVYG